LSSERNVSRFFLPVVDEGRARISQDVSVVVTKVLQTTAGRMIFAKLENSR